MSRYAFTPYGDPIEGTLESVQGKALIIDESWQRDAEGTLEYEYGGETKMYWDSQISLKNDAGKVIYLDEFGEEWTEDEIVLADADGSNPERPFLEKQKEARA